MMDESGKRVEIEISAVKVRIGEDRAAVMFVDNRTRTIYGQRYIDADKEELEVRVSRYTDDVLSSLKAAYQREAILAGQTGKVLPPAGKTLPMIKKIIATMTGGA
jgi:spermidine synthase